MTKQRHLRPGDRLEDDATIVIRGGLLDPGGLRADAQRHHAVYGSYGISVFAARRRRHRGAPRLRAPQLDQPVS